MLVEYHIGFIMVGETTRIKKCLFRKPEETRESIYLSSWLHGICDEIEVEDEVARRLKEELNSAGWGKNFSGWKRFLSTEECIEMQNQKNDWYSDYDFSKVKLNTITTTPINSWKMEDIFNKLTGKQFAQFCIENCISLYDCKAQKGDDIG